MQGLGDAIRVDISFDVSFDGQLSAAYLGIRSTEYVLTKTSEFPLLRPTCIVLKKILNSYGLNKPYLGGMSSFTLLLMVTAFLHLNPFFQSPSQCLTSFLKYYGEIFDHKRMTIMGEHIVELYESSQCPAGLENVPFSVSSPLQPEINIAYNVTRFEEIKTCFLEVYKKIMKEKEGVKHEKILEKLLVNEKIN